MSMKPGIVEVNYNGTSLHFKISTRPSFFLKLALYFLNILLIAVILLFTFGGVGFIVLFIVAFEVLLLRYSVWNLYGTETITLTKDTLSYQQFYGFLKLAVKSFKINKSVMVIPFHENFQAGNKAMKLIFESYDEDNEPVNLYQTALVISPADYGLFIQAFDQMYAR